MKLKLFKAGFYLIVKSRWFKYWSKFYRSLFDSKYKNISVWHTDNLETLNKEISKLTWRKDGLKELYDVCRSPKYVQYCLDKVNGMGGLQPAGALDCDDYAAYCAEVYKSPIMFDRGCLLLVGWFDENNKYHAHMVYTHYHYIENKYSVISNWGLEHKRFENINQVVDYVCGGNTLVGVAFYNPTTLSLIDQL